jgi:hypothetical protein
MKEDYDKAIKEITLIETKHPVKTGFGGKFYDLVPVINKSDSFGKWELDPLFGHMKIVLILENKKEFPESWRLSQVFKFKNILILNKLFDFIRLRK